MKSSEIERLLPDVYRRTLPFGGPLAAILSSMEGMHAPSEAVLERLGTFFDPLTCPEDFLPALAGWVGLGHLLTGENRWSGDTGRLRLLISSAAELSRHRGTRRGLELFLTLAFGREGFAIIENPVDSTGARRPFHFRVEAPAGAESEAALMRRVIESEKPAYTTYELVFPEPV